MTDSVHIVQSRKSNKNSSGVIMMKFQKIFFCCCLIGILFCGCENQKDNHLIEAAMAGDLIYVEKLLEGSKYNQKILDKALFGAIKHEQFSTVTSLLLHGAKFPSGATFPTNADQKTKNSFLLFSALCGKTELVDFLLKNGGDANYYINLSKDDVNLLGVLECAVMADNTFVVKLLLESGAREFFNDKALSTAVEKENLQIVKMLLEKGFEVDDALSTAIEKENLQIVKLLLESGAREFFNDKALSTAIKNNNSEIVKMLLEKGFRDSDALSIAIKNNNLEIVKMLLEKGFSVYRSDIEEAEKKGNQKIIQVLKAAY